MITRVENCNLRNYGYTKCSAPKAKQIAFNGLSDRLGKKIYNGFYDMAVLFPRETTKNPISGSLPAFMRKRILTVTNDIEGASKEIYNTFSKVCEEIRAFEPNANSTLDEIKNKRSVSTVKKLEDVFRKYKILGKWDDFDLKYIDKGGKGSVWKLDGLRHISGETEDEFVIKIFHTKSIQANAYHGCYPEINAATYWMKTLGQDTNRGKFFWGDVHEAYMINKYIDEDVRLPKKFPKPEDYGVKFTDEDPVHIHNVCKQYSYDWGGGVVINQVINSNRFARELMHDIQNKPENYRLLQWGKRYIWKPKGNYDAKFAGLSLSIKFLKPSVRVQCFEKCFKHRGKYNDRAMAYTLKYLPHDKAFYYYKKLATDAQDNVLKEILNNEIPLLATKDEYAALIKDDLLVMDNLPAEYIHKYIDMDRYNKYLKFAKENGITSRHSKTLK